MWAVTCEAAPPGELVASPKVRESNRNPCCPPLKTLMLSVSVPLGDEPMKGLVWLTEAGVAILSGLAARRGDGGNV